MAWFSANWPIDVAWPADVARPAIDPSLIGDRGKGGRGACDHDGKNGAGTVGSHVKPAADGLRAVAGVGR